jgi:hypothetical protein
MLEARALSETGRQDVALEVVANVPGPEAIRLRADIYWAAKHWAQAAEQIELLYGERWREFKPLEDKERLDILRAAVGYALGDDILGLNRFREKFAAKMGDGPDRRAFDILTTPPVRPTLNSAMWHARCAPPIHSRPSCGICARVIPPSAHCRHRVSVRP